ncbi:MAG: hypothetical protein WC415_06675 [Patescibacteria group bacterium]|jgi:3D (Asp-Asp-Asp) domain-containing protein
MKRDIYISIICVSLYVIGSILALADSARVICRQQAEIAMCRDLISAHESYIAMLESRLADRHFRDVIVTAYTARVEECDADPDNTAMMARPVPGRTVAVSRDLFAEGWTFGRSVYIAGFGVFVIEDLMHERHREAIDILVGSVRDARRIGRGSRRAVLIASR